MAESITIDEIRSVSKENSEEILTKLNELGIISSAISLIYNNISGIVGSIRELKDELILLQGTVDAIDAKIIGIQSTQNTIIDSIKSVGDKEVAIDLQPVLNAISDKNIIIDLQPVLNAISDKNIDVDLQPVLNAISDKNIEVDLQPVLNAVENKTMVFDNTEIINAVNGSVDKINANTDSAKNSLSEELKNTNTSQISNEIISMNSKLDVLSNRVVDVNFEPVLTAIREKNIVVEYVQQPVEPVDFEPVLVAIKEIKAINNELVKSEPINFEPVLSAIREKKFDITSEKITVEFDGSKIVDTISDIIINNNISIAQNLNEIKTGINDVSEAVKNNGGTEVEEYNY